MARSHEQGLTKVGGMNLNVVGGNKDKERMGHEPDKGRIGPNERGWLEAKNTFFHAERVGKTMEIEKLGGLLGARS